MPLPSSHNNWDTPNDIISIEISESLKNIRTLTDGGLPGDERRITSSKTETLPDSSYSIKDSPTERLETKSRTKRYLEDEKMLEKENNRVEHTPAVKGSRERKRTDPEQDSDDYYRAIRPTKTLDSEKEKIAPTEIEGENLSGEAEGVSMKKSRPRKEEIREKNYERKRRGYPENSQNPVILSKKLYEDYEEKRKQYNLKLGSRNQNGIERTLSTIAKISTREDESNEIPVRPTAIPVGFRKSRDEENRKANPDIQDIITGIVKILNGNANGDGSAGRPVRPSSTRINNRGPPKISDVPPLDFEGPPSFVPLPPPPPAKTKIPPPYPFDVPPPLPNVPLPPQPVPESKRPDLPTHPFIDGVPIPEPIVPGRPAGRPGDREPSLAAQHHKENKKPVILGPSDSTEPDVPVKNENVKFSSMNNNPPQNVNLTRSNVTSSNFPKPDHNKNKLNGQKLSLSSNFGNKIPMKRPRPRPGQRPRPNNGTKPGPAQNSTLAVAVTEGKIDSANVSAVRNETATETMDTTEPETTLKEEIATVTEPLSEKPSNATAIVSVEQTITEVKQGNVSTPIKPDFPEASEKNSNVTGTESKAKNGTEKTEMDVQLPILLDPSLGIGEATPILESSIPEISSTWTEQSKTGTVALSSSTEKVTSTGKSVISDRDFKFLKEKLRIWFLCRGRKVQSQARNSFRRSRI